MFKKLSKVLLCLMIALSGVSIVNAEETTEPEVVESTETETPETEVTETETPETETTTPEATPTTHALVTATGTTRVSVIGEEWGAGVDKVVVKLDRTIDGNSVSKDDFVVTETKNGTTTTRTVVDAYVSSADGVEITASWWSAAESEYVTVELGVSPTEGNPIIWSMDSFSNSWATSYSVDVELKENATIIDVDEVEINSIDITTENIDVSDETKQIYSQMSNVITKTYTHENGAKVPYGFYTPKEDGHKNGIIIWNHGMGERGSDPKIAMYGNEVTALFGEEFQSVMDGCYVLVPQVMGWSFSAEAVVDLVKEIAATNSDIDLDRVYVAGCSMGGGNTANLVNNYADFFAAAVPICPAGSIEVEKVGNLPTWFIHAENDTTVPIDGTYENVAALEEAGKEVHTSYFENVTGEYTDADGKNPTYDGHWSWVYFFNNACVDEEGINCWEWLAQQTNAEPADVTGTQSATVIGEEWGAGVTKTTITFDATIDVDSIDAKDFNVNENKDGTVTTRKIVAVYASDAEGNKVTTDSKYVTIELAISPTEGNPIIWNMASFSNNWATSYKLYVTLTDGNTLTSGEKTIDSIDVEAEIDIDDVETQNYPQMENVITDSYSYTYTTTNWWTGDETEATGVVPYGFYSPEEDGHKNGIIIWNHGMGEGGTDPKIAMYGNEVTALFGEEFQETMDGIYVLVPQVPSDGSRDAARAGAIVQIVKDLAAENSDIDLNRVYVAGCSAGGGMTTTLVNNYADFFAAAVPICPAGSIEVEKVGNLPTWFIHAKNDGTVGINGTYENVAALEEAGKEVHTSYFENVTGEYTDADGKNPTYDGHWSWVYFFNNACVDEEGVNCWEWLSQQVKGHTVTGTQKVVIEGDDYGPTITKTIISFDKAIAGESLDATDFTVSETKQGYAPDYSPTPVTANRTVKAVYISDEAGNKVNTKASKYVTIEMATSPSEGGAFYYSLSTSRNNWHEYYSLDIQLTGKVTVEDGVKVRDVEVEKDIDLADEEQRLIPQLDEVEMSKYTTESGTTLSYASFEPTKDKKKNPLVIWLHGAGEGGTDPYINMLGNEVSALVSEEFQETMDGAYVLAPQSPTMWADDGEGGFALGHTSYKGEKETDSIYVEDLTELIKNYVSTHSDIDPNRIIIGGCSNGGYMTIRMLLEDADYYAAAYLASESFADAVITDEQIKELAESKVGMWFLHATKDSVHVSSIPTYKRLKEAGKENLHLSEYEGVLDTTGRYENADGTPYEYNAHWAWIYFFNNEAKEGNVTMWEWMAEQSKVELSNETGDNAVIAPFIVMSGLALAGLAFVAYKKRKEDLA